MWFCQSRMGSNVFLPARGSDVQALPGLQIDPRRQHVDVRLVAVPVGDRRPRVAVPLQPRPGGLLELVQHLADLLSGRAVLRSPGDHPRRVLVLEVQAVRDGLDGLRIAAQDLHLVTDLAARPAIGEQVVRRRGRAAMELHHHGASSGSGGSLRSAASVSATSSNRERTTTASSAPLWVFAHRASWLRLFPIRASSRRRSRSRSARPGDHGRTWPQRSPHQGRQRQPALLGQPVPARPVLGRAADPDLDVQAAGHRASGSRGSKGEHPPLPAPEGHREAVDTRGRLAKEQKR